MSSSDSVRQEIHSLYIDHHGWLFGWLRRKLGCAHNAADLTHDTFERLLTSPQHLPLREPRPFLTTIAKRLLIDHGRCCSLEQAYLDALALLPEPEAPSAEHRAIILEALHQLDELLDSLPPKVRTTFLLAQLEGLGYREIAERIGVAERTVKRYMAAAFEHCILLMP